MKFYNPILCCLIVFLFWSCEELLEVEDISGEEVLLLAPSEGTTVSTSTVSFNWNEIVAANSYHIQVAQPSFLEASQIVIDTLVVQDSTYLGANFSKELLDSSYEWRVKALNSDFETIYTTNAFIVNTTGN